MSPGTYLFGGVSDGYLTVVWVSGIKWYCFANPVNISSVPPFHLQPSNLPLSLAGEGSSCIYVGRYMMYMACKKDMHIIHIYVIYIYKLQGCFHDLVPPQPPSMFVNPNQNTLGWTWFSPMPAPLVVPLISKVKGMLSDHIAPSSLITNFKSSCIQRIKLESGVCHGL